MATKKLKDIPFRDRSYSPLYNRHDGDWRVEHRHGLGYRISHFPKGKQFDHCGRISMSQKVARQKGAPDACFRWINFMKLNYERRKGKKND